jgi:MtfA peptidase
MVTAGIISLILIGAIVVVILFNWWNKQRLLRIKLSAEFPEAWREVLSKKIRFYIQLSDSDKKLFEKRVQLFLATKNMEGVETEG